MKILKVFGLIIFLISLMISLVMINGLIHGMELVEWEKSISIIAFILTICLGYLFRKTLLKILLIPFQVFKRDMNQNQRLVLAIFVPVIILFIALVIANSVGYTVIYRPDILTGDIFDKYEGKRSESPFDKYEEPITYYREGNPFDWERTWYIWLFFIIFVCIFEYKLFENKNEK